MMFYTYTKTDILLQIFPTTPNYIILALNISVSLLGSIWKFLFLNYNKVLRYKHPEVEVSKIVTANILLTSKKKIFKVCKKKKRLKNTGYRLAKLVMKTNQGHYTCDLNSTLIAHFIHIN